MILTTGRILIAWPDLFKEIELADAEATLRQAAERESDDATDRSHLGDVYAKTGAACKPRRNGKIATEWRRALPADMENEKDRRD